MDKINIALEADEAEWLMKHLMYEVRRLECVNEMLQTHVREFSAHQAEERPEPVEHLEEVRI